MSPTARVASAPRVVRAVAVAARAAAFLDAAASEIGRVHSVFERAVNVLCVDGRLLALHDVGPLAAPFAIALDERVAWREIEPGTRVEADARGHIVVDAIRVATAHARIVDTAITPGRVRVAADAIVSAPTVRIGGDSARVEARTSGGHARARDVTAGRGPMPRRREPRQLSSHGVLALGAEPSTIRAVPALASPIARAAMSRIAAGIRCGDARELMEGARPLIGLGEGLTPAGDDLLVGVLAILHRARPSLLGDAPDVIGALADAARHGTTAIAREFVLHALDGHFSEPIVALVTAEDADRARRALRRILSMGATSGADTVTGLRLAIDALAD